jgi:perosamine synthetase
VARDLLRRQIGIEVGPGLDEEDLSYTVAAIRKVMAYFRAAYGATGRKP